MYGGKVTAGSQIRSHAAILRRKIPIRLEEMFAIKADAEKALTPGFYAQSWGAVAWLMRMGREKFFPFLSDVESGTSVPDALLKHYGKTLLDMKAGIHSVARTSGHVVELTVEPGNKAAAFAATPVDRATLVYELARFLSHVAVKAGQLDAAAKIVRELAAATADSVGRRDLEQQAARLESTAAVNRHIRMYNEAVSYANTGKNREAVHVLDELLLVATDPLVVRDARRLREEVGKRR